MPRRLRWIALILVVTVIAILVFAPPRLLEVFETLLGLWNVVLLIWVAATLVGFFYWFFLRRILRARRIANIRLERMIEERMEEERKRQNR